MTVGDSGNYFAANADFAAERERLTRQAKQLDPVSIRRIEGLGIANGWNCLEIGAGAGTMAHWLAKRVGPDGRVVATDMNIRFLDNADAANLTIRQQNILTAELEQAWYDLVYARLVLSHLNSDQKVVKRMADAVRPGGWLLVEDYDWGFPRAADPQHLSAQFFNGVWRAAEKAARKSGTLDPNTGGRLRELLVSAGLVNVEHEGVVRSGRGGDTYARLSLLQMEAMMPSLKPTGLITDQDLVRAKALLEDPSFFFLGVGRFAAWGRRPA